MRPRVKRAGTALIALTAVFVAVEGLNAQRRQRVPQPREYEIVELGLRVVAVPDPGGRSTYGGSADSVSQVVAVREGGPAHYAGFVPGDVIFRSNGNYAHPQALMAEASTGRQGRGRAWKVYYRVEGEEAPREQFVSFTFVPVGEGAWITDVPVHRGGRQLLSGRDELRAEARRRFDELHAAALAHITAAPCSVRMGEIRRLAAELDLWKARADPERSADNEDRLAGVAGTVCANARTGGLPSFEAVLWAMTDQRIPPCSYDPAADYTAVLRGDPVRARWDTRTYYDIGIVGRIRQLRSRDPQGAACLMEFLRSSLTGRARQTRAGPPAAAPPPPAAQPARRGERRP